MDKGQVFRLDYSRTSYLPHQSNLLASQVVQLSKDNADLNVKLDTVRKSHEMLLADSSVQQCEIKSLKDQVSELKRKLSKMKKNQERRDYTLRALRGRMDAISGELSEEKLRCSKLLQTLSEYPVQNNTMLASFKEEITSRLEAILVRKLQGVKIFLNNLSTAEARSSSSIDFE
ncbi:uncharacterized protein CANTADRAFT_8190 [Suhomyces tanzawaensis NRRL Y-17324]|uniref:Uncharacterized protein n=1 Tax=Suhomyces tanzawaensis NRRL Y-17324 TaxID=984487 RepID=A0A1E4SBY6_9ASCO|nr:uncharacterized protein CANTADRAFT_8190 [Suhomyces tanzawaensis NRRL Y-17324]ODV77024.1 hypothetical protein CANTADRAFT_8190 [Suhomyces tanzawaensis NRRL Y-17324]